jgi:hypothetical protein
MKKLIITFTLIIGFSSSAFAYQDCSRYIGNGYSATAYGECLNSQNLQNQANQAIINQQYQNQPPIGSLYQPYQGRSPSRGL